MPKPKEIICRGRKYPSINALAAKFGKHPVRLSLNLRNGWSPEEAVGLIKRKRKGHGHEIIIQEQSFSSIRAACEFFNLPEGTIAAPIRKGYTIEDAFAGRLRPRGPSALARKFEFEGTFYPSGTAMAEAYNQRWSNVSRRLNRGWTLSQALKVSPPPPRYRDFDGHARHHTWKEVRLDADNNLEPIPDAQGFKLYEIRNTRNKKVYIGITVGALPDRNRPSPHIATICWMVLSARKVGLYFAISMIDTWDPTHWGYSRDQA
jgi:hypothetical protein